MTAKKPIKWETPKPKGCLSKSEKYEKAISALSTIAKTLEGGCPNHFVLARLKMSRYIAYDVLKSLGELPSKKGGSDEV